ncbi:MAG: ribonuclease III [Mariprofundaceae bacterium]|nr:ribonuclease III [Mariprofundaceae bacterium]
MDSRAEDMSKLASRMGYAFSGKALLEQALTHSSAGQVHLERLEFLGDAVLGMIIADELYRRFPEEQEGKLTRMRAALVCRNGLLKVAGDWQLDALLQVGPGERDQAGRVRSPSICANAVEALIGATFLDAGWTLARALVARAWQMQLETAGEADGRDAKTRLQEYTQAQGWGLPEYTVQDHGTEASPRFTASCTVHDKLAGYGEGERKKTAEAGAAEQAWQKLNP